MTTTPMPDFVQAYSIATGREVSLDPKYGWIIRDGDIGPEVPDPDSAQYRADIEDGLLAKGWVVTFHPHKDLVNGKLEVTGAVVELWRTGLGAAIFGTAPTLAAALIAACLQAKEAVDG